MASNSPRWRSVSSVWARISCGLLTYSHAEQVITTLLPHLHFALPSSTDSKGIRKEIYWRIDGLQVPVVREPHGDFKTAQVPLEVRAVKEEDSMSA